MQPIAIAASSSPLELVSSDLVNGLAPETEGFDFMKYLLGLQEVNAAESTTVSLDMIESADGEILPRSKGSNKKDEQSLMSIIPGMFVGSEPRSIDENVSQRTTVPNIAKLLSGMDSVSDDKVAGSSQEVEGIEVEMNRDLNAESQTGTEETSFLAGLKAFQSQVTLNEANQPKREHKEYSSVSDVGEFTLPQSFEVTSNPSIDLVSSDTVELPKEPMEVPELFSKVETLAQQGGGSMKVMLNPPELGQIEVQVSTQGKNVSVELKSEFDSTKSLLESRLGDLRQSIQLQDLVVNKLEVNMSRDIGRDLANTWTPTGDSGMANGSWREQGFSNNSRSSQNFERDRNPSEDMFAVSAASRFSQGRLGGVDVRV